MTVKILKSQSDLLVDFAAQAAAHAVEMRQWRAHMARVNDDEANGVTGIDKHWPIKPPSSHPLVEAAVNEMDEMDFEIVDDSPTADQVLRQKKDRLFDVVSALETTATEAVLPPRGRMRLLNMREMDVQAKDAEVVAELLGPPSIGKTLKGVIGLGPKIDDVAAEVARRRDPEDHQFLEDQKKRRAAIENIRRQAAQIHNDIEDLTAETIDAFKIPDFTKD